MSDDNDQEPPKKNIPRSREMRDLLREYDARSKKRQGKHVRDTAPKEIRTGLATRISLLLKSLFSMVSDQFSTVLDFSGSIFSRVIRSKILYALFIVVLLILLAPKIKGLLTTHADAYEVLHRIWDEAKQRQSDAVNSESWAKYQSRSSDEITTLVPILKQKADVNNPTSMSLLWIARDYLPNVLQGSATIDDDLAKKIDRHFSDVELNLRRNARTTQSFDWWMLIIIGLDAGLVMGALWYFVLRRLLKRV